MTSFRSLLSGCKTSLASISNRSVLNASFILWACLLRRNVQSIAKITHSPKNTTQLQTWNQVSIDNIYTCLNLHRTLLWKRRQKIEVGACVDVRTSEKEKTRSYNTSVNNQTKSCRVSKPHLMHPCNRKDSSLYPMNVIDMKRLQRTFPKSQAPCNCHDLICKPDAHNNDAYNQYNSHRHG